MELIVVTFNCGGDWNTHKTLLEYGFSEYKMYTVLKKQIIKVNDYLYKATPVLLEDIKYPIGPNEKVQFVITLLKEPASEKIIGKATIYLNGEVVYQVDIYRYY